MRTLRFCVSGSVDDGKSTLIGRLLHDCDQIPDDVLPSLSQQGRVEYSWVTDGLQSEREQGITIDVAYRHFSSQAREFLIADTPGHEEFVRNMASGASHVDAAVLLVDASRGISEQTRRHARILAFHGIRQIIVVINKMDLCGFDSAVFERLTTEVRAFLESAFAESQLRVNHSLRCIPVAAVLGFNISSVPLLKKQSVQAMPWYTGPTLLEALESFTASEREQVQEPFEMPVQMIIRHDSERWVAGRVRSGSLNVGDTVCVLPTRESAQVVELRRAGMATAGSINASDSVTLRLSRELEISRGYVLASPSAQLICAREFRAEVLWLALPQRMSQTFLIYKSDSFETRVQIRSVKSLFGAGSSPSSELHVNEFYKLALSSASDTIFHRNSLGQFSHRFLLIDPVSAETVGYGRVLDADQSQKSIAAKTIWLTGLSGVGKSTLARGVEARLRAMACACVVLDGDAIRTGLSSDLGFGDADRAENMRRVAEVAKLFNDNGSVAIVAMISPRGVERERSRQIVGSDRFIEVYVDAPLGVCEARDPKGLYRRARSGEIANFTGISADYEAPLNPDLHVPTDQFEIAKCVDLILEALQR
jgi:bifunctional enzyme CysN/CysC